MRSEELSCAAEFSGSRRLSWDPLIRFPEEWGCLDLGNAVVHPDLPGQSVEVSMVVPAEQHPVVGVRWAAGGVLVNMVNFAPGRTNGATGNNAAPISRGDRTTLLRSEDPRRCVK